MAHVRSKAIPSQSSSQHRAKKFKRNGKSGKTEGGLTDTYRNIHRIFPCCPLVCISIPFTLATVSHVERLSSRDPSQVPVPIRIFGRQESVEIPY